MDSGSSRKQKLLEKYKNKIAASLQLLDLPSFSDKLLESGVIGEQTNENISSLDYNHVDVELCARYLLRKVSDSIGKSDTTKGKSSRWDRFVKVLLDFSDPGETLNIIGLRCMFDHEEVLDTAAIVEDEDINNRSNRRFKEADIDRLVKVLSKYSSQWEELSIALRLPWNVIEECKEGRTCVIKLYKSLHSWIMGNHPNAEDPTYFNLSLALQPPLSRCSAAVDDLGKEFFPLTEIHKQGSDSSSLMHQLPQMCVKFGASTVLEAKVSSDQPVPSYKWYKDGKKLQSSRSVDICDNIICIQSVTDSGIYSCCINLHDDIIDTKKFYVRVILPDKDKKLLDKYSKLEQVPTDSWPPISPIKFVNIALVTGQDNSFNYTIQRNIDDILETKELVEHDEVFGKFTPGELIFVEGRPGSGKTTLVHKVTRDWAKNLKGLKGAAKVYLVPLRHLNYSKDKSLYDILKRFYLDRQDTTVALDEIKKTSGREVCFIFDGLDEYTENNKENIVMELIYKRVLPQAMVIVASRPVGTAEHRKKTPVNKRIEVLGFTKNSISEYINHYPFDTPCAHKLEKYLKVHHNVLHMCYLPVHTSMICYLYNKLGDNIPNTETKIYENFTCLTVVRRNKREDDHNIEITSLDDLQVNQNVHFNKICRLALGMTLKYVQVVSKMEVDMELDHEPGSDSPFLGLLVIDSVAEMFGYEELYTFLHLTSQEFLTARYVASLEYKQQIKIAKILFHNKQYQSLKFYFGLVKAGSEVFEEFYSKLIMFRNNDVFWMQCAFESQNQSSCQFIGNNILWGEELILSQHLLLPLDFAAVGYVFSKCSNLVLLQLTLHSCLFDDDGIGAFLSTINSYKLRFIKKLKIISHKFPFKAINQLLLHLLYLEELSLLEDKLRDTDLKSIADGVVLDHLKVLHINISIQDKDVAGLTSFGSSCFQELHVYDDYGNIISNSNSLTLNYLLHAHRKKVHIGKSTININKLILCCLDFYEIAFSNFLNCVSFSFYDCGIDDGAVAIIALSLIRSSCVEQIKCLKLDMNNITTFGALFVASILKYSSSIEEFSICGNKINCIGAEAIAESLAGCRTLRTVDMQLNAIGDRGAIAVARSAAEANIRFLYLCNSKITENGINEVLKYKEYGTLIRTTKLRIQKDILQAYPQLLDKFNECCHNISKIRVIDMIGCESDEEFAEDFNKVRKILEALKQFTCLTHLNLEKCQVGEQGADILAKELKNCSKLEVLNLCNSQLNSRSAMTVAGALKYCPKLEVLNMSINALSSSECIASLADGLRHTTAIKELDFSDTYIGSNVSSVLVIELSRLHKLNLSSCGIDSNSAKLLAVKLQHCSCLQHLNLGRNGIGSGMINIVQALQTCQSLQHLNLIHTGIDADCVEVLADGLKLNNQLQVLCLAGNKFSQEVAFKLGRSLCHCNKLRQLRLQECCIDDKGAMALSEGLKHCKYLDFISLSCNQIGTEGAFALAKNLKFCSCLQNVFLNDNPIEDEGAIELYEQLKHTKNIYLYTINFKKETQSKLMKLQAIRSY